MYPANIREEGPRSRGFRVCSLVVGGKGVYIWFSAITSFGNISYWDGFLPKSSKWLRPFDACHKGK